VAGEGQKRKQGLSVLAGSPCWFKLFYAFDSDSRLWQERCESDVWIGWIRDRSEVVAAGGERVLNILYSVGVRKHIVWIVQVWSVVDLEQSRFPIAEEELHRICIRVGCTDVADRDFISSVIKESRVKLGCIVQLNVVVSQVAGYIHRVECVTS